MHPLLKAHIEKKEFHHAYLLCGDTDECQKAAIEAARAILSPSSTSKSDFDERAHPDFSRGKFELFGIEDSRDLKNWAASRSFYGNGKVFVAEIFAFNSESSNALLKILEEPNEGVHFFIIASSAEVVMPTLRSRLTVIELGHRMSKSGLDIGCPSGDLELAEKFLKDSPNKRLEIAKKMADEKKADKTDKAKIVEFLNGLEISLERKLRLAERKKAISAMEELQKSREFIFDRGSSAKMILEHLALVLPKF